jgi:hypothetical protein
MSETSEDISFKTSGQIAIGFETRNGQVYYQLYAGDVDFMDVVDMFESEEINEDDCDKTAESVDEYLESERLYENEDSMWRIVLLRDGVIVGKQQGKKGIFKYEGY